MAKQRDREAFVGLIVSEGGSVSLARALMRASATLQRLAEAQCNGDWPADNGQREVEACTRCGSSWVPESMRRYHDGPTRLSQIVRVCQECQKRERVVNILKHTPFKPTFGGDPRGAVIRLHVPSGRGEEWGGVAVP